MKRKIKICGVKEPQDVSVCNDIGVDFIGFNFANISPRKINPKYAKEKKLYEYCDKIERVAVFVNPSDDHFMESTKSIKDTSKLNILLCGSKSMLEIIENPD